MRTEERIVTGVTSSHRVQLQRAGEHPPTARDESIRGARTLRMLRLAQVRAMTGLGKTKIYELQAEGSFPMRIKITGHSVAWIEDEVQEWLARRVESSTPLSTL
jgi:prophage regulatory protein